ncbi:hypothetical protein BJP36_40400 [Moorena producens JHB]|uniref:Uncharacterized protein n=1 Tax=Moorena producens (strain JHB) TaxID=1454205 RepID=A0A9Q9SS42_MOOP1|nr:hypothetical protein [Moorena producens]WAN68637.1 hypothetical protein BJP36_40400 [Moorena producens JHB]
MPIPDCRFPIADSRLPIPDCRFPIADSRFPYLKPKTPIAGVSLSDSVLSKKSQSGQASGEHRGVVTEDPKVARVSRKFIAANRPPSTDKKDF